MKLKSFMDEAYRGKTRNKKLGTRKGKAILDLEDLAEQVGENISKEKIAELVPSDPNLLARLVACDPGKKYRVIWGYLSSLYAEKNIEPLRLPPRDYTGLELTDGIIVLERGGDHVGERMRGGKIFVKGEAGDFLGQELSGGGIVAGSCNDYAFRHMQGGWAVILGKAGNYAGLGNNGGRIVIRGDAGKRSGWLMRSGSLRILGDAGDYLGLLMSGGEINVDGRTGSRAGWRMRGGTIKARIIGSEAREGATGGQLLKPDQ
ncbi:MAG: hypothetical protein MUO26_12090 [Methanotrichaceae archaeon]|nr:hypothetical protein [Methanotrichaceae archaeon]